MMRRLRVVVAAVLGLGIALSAEDAHAQVAGLNMGAPVWKGVVATDALNATIATGAPHVRVNFRLDDWSAPDDPKKVNGKTFFEVYDGVVDAITSQGLEVYALLNDEIVTGLGPKDPGFEEAWVKNALLILDHYKDRVRVWETINEPNNWDETQTARMPASSFASAHARLYDAAKVKHAGDACWDVSLVTGPLFSFDGTTATDYLDAAIENGRAGGAWKGVRDVLGRDPIDGVGYHVYVGQGTDSTSGQAALGANQNLDAVRALLTAKGLGDKRVWLSEIGYRASLLGDQGQADRLDATFASLGTRTDLASIQWFTIADFGGDETWGLFGSSFLPAEKRTAHARFVAQAKTFAPPLAARLTIEAPKKAAPGAKLVAKVTATNLGKKPWTANGNVRLGAAAGCPSAWATNAVAFDTTGASGYAASLVDARRYLTQGAAQGETITIEVPVIAPTTMGRHRLALRMVEEGVAWFGATASADIDVAPGLAPSGPGSSGSSGGEGPDATSPDAGAPGGPFAIPTSGCGCTTTPTKLDAGALGVATLAVGALVRRRKRQAS